jgi:hypothetical protein
VKKVYSLRKPRADVDYLQDMSSSSTREVVESEPYTVNTGVLDPHGNEICYTIYNDPIGFLWHDEEGNLVPRDELLARYGYE